MSQRYIKVVAFDLDGTLIDSKTSIVHGLQKLCEHLQHPLPDLNYARGLIGLPLPDIFERLGMQNIDYEAYRRVYSDHMYDHMEKNLRSFPRVQEVIANLSASGYEVALVTSRGADSIYRCLEMAKIDAQVFRTIITRDDTSEHKPSARPLLLACERIGITPEEMVYVGDAEVDMQAAHAAKAWSIFASYGAENKHSQFEHFKQYLGRIACVSEIPALL